MKILIALMLLTHAAFGQGTAVPAQGPPPRNLVQRPDGRFTANEDPTNPERFEVHVVVAGDTLSQIAGRFMNNPRLWPQLWEQNEHIVNPHWIYPNDKILIRPVTQITEAAPPPPPEPPPAVEPPAPAPRPALVAPPIQAAAPPPAQDVFILTPPPSASEVKAGDLYCSGFIRTQPVADTLKVISRFNGDFSALATETDYIYLSQGSEEGVRVGDMYQVIRPTKRIDSPARRAGERDRGLHYLDVGQIQVVITQADFSLARVVHSCEAVEIGDFMIPFQRIDLPAIPRPRPFSPFMVTSGQAPGIVISTKNGLGNFGSTYQGLGTTPGIRKGNLAPLERGIATEGTIAYLDLGQADGVRPGDIFIAFKSVSPDGQLYRLPPEAKKLQNQRAAVGELIILKVGERASTALVTYAVEGISLGDYVERR